MPNAHRGLAAANGVAQGVNSFLQSFLQVSQMKNQEKLQKNSHIEQLLLSQIQDPNTDYYTRAKMIDAIGSMYKTDRPLSHILGYDKLNEQDFLDPNQPAKDVQTDYGKQAQTEGSTISNLEKAYSEADPNYTNQTPIVKTTPQGTTKRGNLTPNDIEFQKRKSLQEAADASDISKAERIAKINFDLQEKSYKANGYKVTSEGVDSEGNYVQILTNNSGDTKINKLPKGFKPIKQIVSEISGNRPSTTLRNLEEGYLTKINPATGVNYTEEEASAAAAKDFAEQYNAKTNYLKLGGKQKTQQITGTAPPTPAQTADDKRADEDRKRQAQIYFDEATADEKAALETREALAKQKTDAWAAASDALIKFKKIQEKKEPDDPEWRDAEIDYNRKDTIARNLEEDYRKAHESYTRAVSKKTAAYERLIGNPSGSSNGNQKSAPKTKLSPKVKAAIKVLRAHPEANPGIENMTDEQIAEALKGKID